ncbi:MAG TPA: TIGR03936 family radical SAM-associated protein [Isosphaeraceae bacterium]
MTAASEAASTSASKVRLRFAKIGELRLVSHHDLMRCLERAIRRAAIPVAHSQGFNPRPRVVFALALGLGIEGHREVVELELAEPMPPAEVLRRLAGVAPPGLVFLEAEPRGAGRAPRAEAALYALDVPADRRDAARAALAALLAGDRWPYTRHRPDRTVAIDLRPFVLGADLDPNGVLRLHLKVTPEGSARPEEVLDALGLRDLLEGGTVLARTDLTLADRAEPGGRTPAGGDPRIS